MNADDPLDRLVDSVSDGATIDWERAESLTFPDDVESSVRALRELAGIAEFNRALQHPLSPGRTHAVGTADGVDHPSRWGQFTLLEPVGSGAHGEVWRAWDVSLHREVAVKFIQEREVAADDASRGALLDEARAVARVRHPNVVSVYGIGEYDGRAGMWMELLRGPTLAREIERVGALPVREVTRIGLHLVAALQALDAAGLVHRDIKPSNVVLETDGRAVLTDFGLGWRRTLTAGSASQRPSGTPLFMAPSLLAGGSPTPRTDLYALGVSLRWALTGQPPFQSRTLEELKEQAPLGPAESLAAACPDAPRGLIAAIERAMDVAPGANPCGAAEIQALLESALSSLGGPEGPSRERARQFDPPRRPAEPSIAVLPFLDRSQDGAEEYFADGLADELLNVLSRIRGLHVAARTSSFQFKGKNEDLEVIGRKLGVSTLLEGSVRKAGSQIRISVRLVRVSDGAQLWSDTYDRTLGDIFEVQDDIARHLVEALRAALLPTPVREAEAGDVQAEIAAAVAGRGHDPEAHRLFLQGRHFIFRKRPDDLAKGIDYLRQAVEQDPDFALAWAELGSAYADQIYFGQASTEEGYGRARVAVLRALALQPHLPAGHARMARIQIVHDWDWYGAEASLRKALDGDPANATALHGAAVLLQGMGRSEEAIALNLRVLARDPLSAATHNNLGCVYYEVGRLLEAEELLRMALELAPQRYGTRSFLAQVLVGLGRCIEALEEALREPDDVYRLLALVLIHHREGRRAESDAVLQELATAHAADCPLQVAEAHGARGEADEAFRWLERAYAQRDAGLVNIKPSRHFQALRADPRWSLFLRKLGLDA